MPNPLLKAAATLALGDVHQIVHKEFAVAPRLGPNQNGVA